MRACRTFFIAVALIVPTIANAQTSPVQISLFNPVQIVSEDKAIKGVRLSILYGRNTSVVGLDMGFINHSTSGLSKGLQAGIVGYNEGDFAGWQGNAVVNVTMGNFLGLQQGFFNELGSGEGVQVGAFNKADSFSGVQIGLINYAVNLEGIQIGFINVIRNNGVLPVMPLVNWSF